MKNYALFNPKACSNKGEILAKELKKFFAEDTLEFVDLITLEDKKAFLENTTEEDQVIICGGDGTLNKFVNDTQGLDIKAKILYYACGSGNDFYKEVGTEDKAPVEISKYVQNLPTVTVKGKDYKFINGVGYGIDGYCCEVGDNMRSKNVEKINYTSIAIKGLLFHYKPCDATVIVDGEEHRFKKVWLAPVMHGKYYGGGMIPTPEQKREDDTISLLVFHGSGKLKTLMIFPSIFKGEHVKKKKHVTTFAGKTITVKFDSPRPLQIDGETILEVSEYTATR